jgi:hypothetical protein
MSSSSNRFCSFNGGRMIGRFRIDVWSIVAIVVTDAFDSKYCRAIFVLQNSLRYNGLAMSLFGRTLIK